MRRRRTGRGGFADDDVFDNEAWTVPLLECPGCSAHTDVAVDVGQFLRNERPRLYPVELERLGEHADSGLPMACPNGCGVTFRITKLLPGYLWHAKGTPLEAVALYGATAIGN
ncbi:MAG: hypothetical protein R2705_13080 [Ilumatobacteraceae bacterium]